MKKITVLLAVLLWAGSLVAGPVKISITDYGDAAGTSLQDLLNSQLPLLEAEVNEGFPDIDQSTYLKGMANAGTTATRGIGVDYVPNMSLFMLGFGMGMGLDLGEGGSMSDFSKVAGFGAQAGFVGGLNLRILPFLPEVGPIDLKKTKLYVNFFAMDIPKVDENLTGNVTSFGLHAQNKIIDGVSAPLGIAKWYGVDVSTGMDYSSQKIHYVYPIEQTKNIDTGVDATVKGPATLGAEMSTFTIPIEVSSGVGFLWIFNLYAGAGLDLNFASATSVANIAANVTFTGTTAQAKASMDLGSEDNASVADLRLFVGTQLDFSILKLDVQLQKNITNNAMAVNFGTRIYW